MFCLIIIWVNEKNNNILKKHLWLVTLHCYCCVLIITESWLHPGIPDASMQPAGRGVCIYMHENWCNNGTIIDEHCSLDLKYMSVRGQPCIPEI